MSLSDGLVSSWFERRVKWVGWSTASLFVLGILSTVVTGAALIAQSQRLAVVESRAEDVRQSLERIENKLDRLIERSDGK